MMNRAMYLPVLVAVFAWPMWASAQSTPVLRQTFESGTEGWTPFGQTAKVETSSAASDLKAGKSALKFSYGIAKGEMNAMMLPIDAGKLSKAKSVRLWMKSDHTTTALIVLQEKGGGRYMANFMAPADAWQRVELSTSDFTLNEGKDDPKDPDGKLDLDQVEAVMVSDFGQFFAQAEGPIAELFNIKFGAHNLVINDFEVSEDALPASATTSAGELTVDTFSHPQISWIGVGGVRLSVASGKIGAGKALQADYKQAPMKITGIVRSVRRGSFEGMKTLSLTVASAKACKLTVQVEETDGGKYNTLVDVPGGSVPTTFKLPFSELIAADDSKDTNGKLDVELINQIVIIDIYGLISMAEGDNTLWVGNLKATK